jgi:hypothetical protein
MRIYVAGSTAQIEMVRGIQDELIGLGHRVTYDWTNFVMQHGDAHKDDVPMYVQRDGAEQDLSGVQGAHGVIAYVTPECIGTLIEIGMALHKQIPVLVLRRSDSMGSVFYTLEGVTHWVHHSARQPMTGPIRAWLEEIKK